jgi:hypothetical protein
MRPTLAAAALAVSLALPAAAYAQDTEPHPQQRVMVTLTRQREVEGATNPQAIRGTLLEMDADSMTIQMHPGTGPLRVSRGVVRRMYVSRGVPSRTQSAAVGTVGGAALGALVGWLNKDARTANGRAYSSGRDAALAGAAFGAGLGLVSGALFPHERWHRIRLPARLAVAPAPGEGDGWVVAVSADP